MRIILIVALILASGLAQAEFKRDIGTIDVMHKLGYITLKDIPIGESAVAHVYNLCTVNNKLSLSSHTIIETKKNDFSSVFLVTKTIDKTVKLTIYAPKRSKYEQKETEKRILNDVFTHIAMAEDCSKRHPQAGGYIVESIDNITTLSKLMEKLE